MDRPLFERVDDGDQIPLILAEIELNIACQDRADPYAGPLRFLSCQGQSLIGNIKSSYFPTFLSQKNCITALAHVYVQRSSRLSIPDGVGKQLVRVSVKARIWIREDLVPEVRFLLHHPL